MLHQNNCPVIDIKSTEYCGGQSECRVEKCIFELQWTRGRKCGVALAFSSACHTDNITNKYSWCFIRHVDIIYVFIHLLHYLSFGVNNPRRGADA